LRRTASRSWSGVQAGSSAADTLSYGCSPDSLDVYIVSPYRPSAFIVLSHISEINTASSSVMTKVGQCLEDVLRTPPYCFIREMTIAARSARALLVLISCPVIATLAPFLLTQLPIFGETRALQAFVSNYLYSRATFISRFYQARVR